MNSTAGLKVEDTTPPQLTVTAEGPADPGGVRPLASVVESAENVGASEPPKNTDSPTPKPVPVMVTRSPPASFPLAGETLTTLGLEHGTVGAAFPDSVAGGVSPPGADWAAVGAHGTGTLSPPPPWVEQSFVDARSEALGVDPIAEVLADDFTPHAATVAIMTAAPVSHAVHWRIGSRISGHRVTRDSHTAMVI